MDIILYYPKEKEKQMLVKNIYENDFNKAYQKEKHRIRELNKQRLNQQKENEKVKKYLEREVDKQLTPIIEKTLAELFRNLP